MRLLMKRLKNIAAGILAAAAVFLISGTNAAASESKAPHIVGQEEVIYLDGKDQIAVEGGEILSVSYLSGNPAVAAVNQKGVVKPKSRGSAVIRAKAAYRQENGKKKTEILQYTVKVLGKSTEYFIYNKENQITGLKPKAAKRKSLSIPGYNGNGKKKISQMYGTALTGNKNLRYLSVSDNLETFVPHVEDEYTYSLTDCPNLKSIRLGKNFGSLGYLRKCPSVESIFVDERNASYQAVDGVLFSKNEENLSYYPAGKKDAAYTIPDGTKYICGYAFYEAAGLDQVYLPDSVILIGEAAFQNSSLRQVHFSKTTAIQMDEGWTFSGCSNLESVTIPEGVTRLTDYLFEGCTSLKTVILPSTLVQLSGSVFSGCGSLTDIRFADENDAYQIIDGAVYTQDGKKLSVYPAGNPRKSYTISTGTETIGESAFQAASFLQEVLIPDSVVSIERYAFAQAGLRKVSVPDSVVSLETGVFDKCKKLSEVTLMDGLERLDAAFGGCTALKSIRIPASVTSIAYAPFEGCKALKEILADEASSSFRTDGGVLYNKNAKKLLCYPQGRTDASFTLPETVEEIAPKAFSCLTYMKHLDVSGAEMIGGYAFERSKSLETVVLPKKMEDFSVGLFAGCTGLVSVVLPDGIPTIPYQTFENCTKLETVVIGKNVSKIEGYAFTRCGSLKKLVVKTKKLTKKSLNSSSFVESGEKRGVKLSLSVSGSRKNEYKKFFKKAGLSYPLIME